MSTQCIRFWPCIRWFTYNVNSNWRHQWTSMSSNLKWSLICKKDRPPYTNQLIYRILNLFTVKSLNQSNKSIVQFYSQPKFSWKLENLGEDEYYKRNIIKQQHINSTEIKTCGMISNEKSIHKSSKEVSVINYRQLYGIQ